MRLSIRFRCQSVGQEALIKGSFGVPYRQHPFDTAVRRCLTRVFPYGIPGKFADGQMDRSFGGFVFIGQMAWLGAVCFCWSRADVVGHLIEEVGIMLEVGCLFEALRKALGALVEQKLSDVVTL